MSCSASPTGKFDHACFLGPLPAHSCSHFVHDPCREPVGGCGRQQSWRIASPSPSRCAKNNRAAAPVLRMLSKCRSCWSIEHVEFSQTLLRADGDIQWTLSVPELWGKPAVFIASPAFTACCPSTLALSATLQWCAPDHQQSAALRSGHQGWGQDVVRVAGAWRCAGAATVATT